MAGRRNPEEQSDDMKYILFGVALIFIVAGIWIFGRKPLAYFSFGLDYIQLLVISTFVDLPSEEQMWLNAAKDILFMPESSFMQTYGAGKSQIPLEWFNETSSISGNFFKWLFAPIIISLGIYASFKMKGQGFQRKFTLTGNKFGPF